MEDIVQDIECNSRQDKFLIMLLERIQKLEDALKRNDEYIELLLSQITSTYFTVYLSGKYNSVTKEYTNLTTVINDIVKTTTAAVPCKHIYASYYHLSSGDVKAGCFLVINTQQSWLLKSIVTLLDERLCHYVNLNSWSFYNEWELDLDKFQVLL